MTVEGDLVADFGLVVIDPGIGSVGLNFALEVGLHILMQRDVLGVAKVAIRLRGALELALGDEDDVAVWIPQRSFGGDGAGSRSPHS